MCILMSQSYQGASELRESSGRGDEVTKKGACLLEMRRTGMVQWGQCKHMEFTDKHGENNPQLSSPFVKHREAAPQLPPAIVKEELEDDEAMTINSLLLPELKKRKGLSPSEHRELPAVRRNKARKTSLVYKRKKIKHENSISVKKENVMDRWSLDRYNMAEKSMLEVMKAEGAVFENPIPRSALRMAARKLIGDTGLLDHLLKHIDGKVAPGGTERFRRCYNTAGVMEYWLESADLVKIKQESGVPDPNYVPPSWWRPGSIPLQDSVSAGELTVLKEELAKMKRNMEELESNSQEQQQANQIGEIYQEFVKWRDKSEQKIMDISRSLTGLQDMYKELMSWKSKAEEQLVEISNSLSSIQASKQCTTLSPVAERWEDWLESTNLDNIPGEDLAPWLENADLVNVRQNALVHEPSRVSQPWMKPCDSLSQDLVRARDLELLKEEMAKMKRDVQELIPKRMEEDQANMTPDSSATANSKSDLDNPSFQEMFKELGQWRAKMDQQMQEISIAVNTLQASNPYSF